MPLSGSLGCLMQCSLHGWIYVSKLVGRAHLSTTLSTWAACHWIVMSLRAQLSRCAFLGDDTRLDVVLNFLQLHEIDELHELANFPNVRKLDGANVLLDSELSLIDNLARDQTSALRIEWARPSSSKAVVRAHVAPVADLVLSADVLAERFCKRRAVEGDVGATVGPMKSIKRLQLEMVSDVDRIRWLEEARLEAILGCCSHSIKSVKSGIRCYLAFAEKLLKKTGTKLPPSVNELLAWSVTFRCKGTFSNYLGYVRVGCLIEGVPTIAFDDPVLARAKKSILRRGHFTARAKLFVRMDDVGLIMESCYLVGDFDEKFGMLFLITYIFLLRLPSEALPIVRGVNGVADYVQKKAVLYLAEDCLCLKLSSRKNIRTGSLLKRGCWCKSARFLVCPVHVVWPFICKFEVGEPIFHGISPSLAINTLRKYLGALGKANAVAYRCHDI